MGYNFFAYLNRMKYIERWSLMRSVTRENIMEHSGQVAQIAHALAVINNRIFGGSADPGKAAVLALFHETGEVITGDLPTPVKYFNNKIKSAYKELEKTANDKLLTMLPDELKDVYTEALEPDIMSVEYILVKAADKLSAYIKCVEEVKSGNKEFQKALKTIEEALKQSDIPEIGYFMDKFIKGYTLTLDELD